MLKLCPQSLYPLSRTWNYCLGYFVTLKGFAGWLPFWADVFTDRKIQQICWDENQADIWDISGLLPWQISVNYPG